MLYGQMRPELTTLGQMAGNGLGKGQERASVIGLWREQSSLGEGQ